MTIGEALETAAVVTNVDRECFAPRYMGKENLVIHITEITAWRAPAMRPDDVICRCYEGHMCSPMNTGAYDLHKLPPEAIEGFSRLLFPTGGKVPCPMEGMHA